MGFWVTGGFKPVKAYLRVPCGRDGVAPQLLLSCVLRDADRSLLPFLSRVLRWKVFEAGGPMASGLWGTFSTHPRGSPSVAKKGLPLSAFRPR
jgi:hypothetical protein